VLVVANGPLRRSVDAARPFACGVSAVLATLAVAAPSAHAADTPARVFEQVTPVHKYSSDVNAAQTASADGDALAYNTYGTMEGGGAALFLSTYIARRGDDGWHTQGFTAIPAVASPNTNNNWGYLEPSADFNTFYASATPLGGAAGPDDQNSSNDVVAVHAGGTFDLLSRPDGAPTTDSGDAYYAGRAEGGGHVLFSTSRTLIDGVADDNLPRLYDATPAGVKLVSVDEHGAPVSDALLGSRLVTVTAAPDRTAISSDGSQVVFAGPTNVYARIDGTTTIPVSASQKAGAVGTPATSAKFMGAAQDGSRIVFSSPDQLTDNAPTGGGIYAFDVASRTLSLIAAVASPHIVRISPDGARVYFHAAAQLVPGKGTAGADNLYVADDGSGVRYIATVDAGSAVSLYNAGESLSTAVVSPDGTRLAFRATANLTSYNSAGQTEVYVYDDTAHRVTCASCPSGGAAATGGASIQDNSSSGANPGTYMPRGFTTDNRLFFSTPQALVAGDGNGVSDVYEADPDGARHLISTGTGPDPAYYADNSADGRDVFFTTRSALAASDIDNGVLDVYDARVGGRAVPVAPPACSGDGCKPPASAPPVALSLDSATAFDTSKAPVSSGSAKTTFRVSAIGATARSAWVRTGTLALKVRVSDAAEVRVSGRAAIGRKTLTVASGRAMRTGAGSVTVKVRLTTAARSALRRSGRLTVRLTVSSTGTSKTAHTTAVLRASRKASR
jgi:hypothetical protein